MELIKAVKKGLFSEVEKALNQKQPVHMVDTAGFSALHWAAIKGNPWIIELLVSKGAVLDQPATKLGVSPLQLAVVANQLAAAKKLIDLGAVVDYKNIKGQTALELAVLVNVKSDALKLFGKHIPVMRMVDQLEGCFDTIELLLQKGAALPDSTVPHRLVLNALARDRVSTFKAIVERGFDYRSLNDEEFAFVGFDYALIFAAANCAVDCLDYLVTLNPDILKANPLSYGGQIKRNMVSWANQQLPEESVFQAPYQFFAAQAENKLVNPSEEDLKLLLPVDLQNCDVDFAYDAFADRYYINRLEYGYSFLYFDKDGQFSDADRRFEQLENLLQWYQRHAVDLNCHDETNNRSAQFTLHCPRAVIELFMRYGMKYEGYDLYWAVRECSTNVVDLLIDHCPLDWKNGDGKTALDILSSDSVRDELLNRRGEFIKRLQDKALIENLNALSVEVDSGLEEISGSVLVPQFEALNASSSDEIPGAKPINKKEASKVPSYLHS
jgi:hypothetical protein